MFPDPFDRPTAGRDANQQLSAWARSESRSQTMAADLVRDHQPVRRSWVRLPFSIALQSTAAVWEWFNGT